MAKKETLNLREFRSKIARLKKAGIVHNIDSRSAKPTTVRQGKKLLDTVAKYDDFLSDKVSYAFPDAKEIKNLRKAGYHTHKLPDGRTAIVIPKSATEKVKLTKEGKVEVSHPSGIKRVKHAVPYRSLAQWLRDMKKNADVIDGMKSKNQWFVYKIRGYMNHQTYTNIDDLLDSLENGSTSGPGFVGTSLHLPKDSQDQVFQELEIMTWEKARPYPEPVRGKGKTSPEARQRYRKRIKGTAKGEALRQSDAARKRAERAAMSEREKEVYREKARKRSQESRNRRKPKPTKKRKR